MLIAEKGTTVTVNYTGHLPSGQVIDSTLGGPAMEFVVGDGKVIKGFEHAVLGMKPGETKTVHLPPEECYGHRQHELVVAVPKANLPEGVDLAVGQQVNVAADGNRDIPARVVAVDHTSITLDANHPLAGETLTYEIAVLEVTPP